MHMNKQYTLFFLVILLLHKRHQYSQSRGLVTCQWTQPFSTRNPDNSPKAHVCSPYILLSPKEHERSLWHYFMTSWSSALLFQWKTTAHVQTKCHHLSVHLPASMPKSLVTIATPKPYHLFLIPNFMPVTYISLAQEGQNGSLWR